MLRQLNRSSLGRRILGVPTVGMDSARIVAETATGDNGPGLLYDEALARPGERLRLVVRVWPKAGSAFVHENGLVEFSGAPAGVYTLDYDVESAGVVVASDTATFRVGAVDSAAPGVVLAGDGTLLPGDASGVIEVVNAAAPGAIINGDGALVPGAASGEQNADAPGASLIGDGTVVPGTALGINAGDASADGAVLAGDASLVPGDAVGQLDAGASGANLLGDGALVPGAASGDLDASAPGAMLDGGGSLLPGLPRDGSAPVIYRVVADLEKRTRIGVADSALQPYLKQEILLDHVYMKGEVVRLHARIASPAGIDEDPPALSLFVRFGAAPPREYVFGVDQEIVRADLGRFYADIPLTQRGFMYYRWQTDAQARGAGEGRIVVRAGRFAES